MASHEQRGSDVGARNLRVLAVDDDHNILALLQTALASMGSYEIALAHSGDDALRQIKRAKEPFDCFLLDIQMPQMDGITLCREIRALEDYQFTPILMLTAMSERKYVDESFLAGANDYVTKPFELAELRRRLASARKLLENRGQTAQAESSTPKLKHALNAQRTMAFEDPIEMSNVDRLLGKGAFENYVTQLGQGRRFTSYVTAVRVEHANRHFDTMGARDFSDIMEEVARGISKYTSQARTIFCYHGAGNFLCVDHRRSLVLKDSDYDGLNRTIAGCLKTYGYVEQVSCDIGLPVSLRLTSKSRALIALQKAISYVQTPDAVTLPALTLGRTPTSQAEFIRAERSAYEAILKDVLTEEPALNRY